MSYPTANLSTETVPDVHVLERLNAVRLIVVFLIGVGYASTMSLGPDAREWMFALGYNPSLYGLQVLFFLSGWLALRSLSRGRTVREFVASRARRILPIVAIYTLVVVTVLYPILCDHDAPIVKSTSDLVLYFLKTVTLVAPGQPMPGALDHALYPCNLQGAIWSLRWGALAYVGFLSLHLLRLRGPAIFTSLAILCAVLHIAMSWWTDSTGSDLFAPVATAARLSFPFMTGVAAYAWRDRLPKTGVGWGLMAFILLGAATLHYYGIRWTYTIEVMAASGWCALAMALLHSRARILEDWPNLVLPFYLGVWPTAQLILWVMPDITVPGLVGATLAVAFALACLVGTLMSVACRPLHRCIQTA